MNITIYTTPTCKVCKKVKAYFKSKNVEYTEVDMSIGGIKKNQEMKKMFKKMKLKTYPVVIIQKDDEDEMIFPEFDEDIFDELLKEN